jgi:hypothetical protein
MSSVPANVIPDRKKMPFGGAEAVVSDKLISTVNQLIVNASTAITDTRLQEQFLTDYRTWIESTRLNAVKGLDLFPVAAYSNGTSEAFDKFYLKHHTRRFRCFRAEYMYHQAAWRNYFPNWKFIEDEPLSNLDAVVISMPFSDLGDAHPQTQAVLDRCAELGIPVLLDCAYFGICQGMTFDFTHPAITDITFSLSKFFPVSHLRIGMRLTKVDDDDSLLVLNKTLYTNRIGLAVGLQLINQYSPDYICETYGSVQQDLCDQLGITASKCVIFGIDHNNQYSIYNRGLASSRLCLAKYLDTKTLPENVK